MQNSNRLATIVDRQRKTRLRDVAFALCVALAAVVSITALDTACDAATTSQISHR